ncbi:MAG: hypothetical protein KDK23_04735 [Leptospiraceae bacterium]|nr:hypothetical protein [Leptospiraceae bacterium]
MRFLGIIYLAPLLLAALLASCNQDSNSDDSLSALLLAGGASEAQSGNSSGEKGSLKIVNISSAGNVVISSTPLCGDPVLTRNLSTSSSTEYIELPTGTYYSSFVGSPCSPALTIEANKKYLLIEAYDTVTDGKVLFAEVDDSAMCAGQSAVRFANNGRFSSATNHRLYADGSCSTGVGSIISADELAFSAYNCYAANSYYHHDDPPCAGPDLFAVDKHYTVVSAGTDSVIVVEE